MDVAVHKIGRVVLVQQLTQCFKSHMCRIITVAKALHWSVCDDNVNTAGTPKVVAELTDAPAHLLFGVLVRTGMVFTAAAKSENAHTVVDDELVIDAVTTLRRTFFVVSVVIAMDIQQRAARHGDKE